MNFAYQSFRHPFTRELSIETVEPLGIDGYTLELSTHKANRSLSSFARVYKHTADGFKSTDLFGDWNKVLATATGRATEKALIGLHEKALDSFPQALEAAKAHTLARIAQSNADEARAAARRAHDASADASMAAREAMADFNHPSNPAHY